MNQPTSISEIDPPASDLAGSDNGGAPVAELPTESTAPAEPEKPKSNKLQFVWTVGFAFAIVGLQLGQGILLARLLGPEGRGAYAAAVLYVQLLLYIGLMGGLEVICRAATADHRDLAKLRRSALWLGITTGAITMVAVIGLSLFALPAAKSQFMPLALLCSLSLIGQHVMLIMTAVDRGSGEFGKYNTRRLIAAAAFPVALLIAALLTQVTVAMTCALFVLASIVSMVACVIGVPRPFTGPSERPTKNLLRESRPYGLSMLATDLFERLDLLLILWMAPLVDQGFYAAMVPAVYPLTVIPNTLGLFLFNAGANKNKRFTRTDIHRIIGSSVAIQTLMTVVFMLLIAPVVLLLYGDPYEPAIKYALLLAPVSAIRGILQGLDSYLKGRGRPLAPVRARVVAMTVMVVVAIALFPRYGTIAIAIAALAGQVLCFVWLSWIVYADVDAQHLHSIDDPPADASTDDSAG